MGGELRWLIRRQYGVVTRRQLMEAGMTARMVEGRLRAGRLHAVHRGVYSVGRADLEDRGRWVAAVLAAGPGALLSHRSAAALWKLRGFGTYAVEVTCVHGSRRDGLMAHESVVPARERAVRERIPVTTVARTLVDLAEVVTRDELERAVHEAYRLRCFHAADVEACIARHPRRNGTARLRDLLADQPAGAERTRSWLEMAFLRVCRDHGLPLPDVNVIVEGRERDFCWPERRLVVETDGRHEHLTPRAFEDDHERDALLSEAGYATRRFTYRQITERPRWVAERIRAALGA